MPYQVIYVVCVRGRDTMEQKFLKEHSLFWTGSPPFTRFFNNVVFKIIQLILVFSFVHLVLNHSSTETIFCSHGYFSKVSKSSISWGPPVSEFLQVKRNVFLYSWHVNEGCSFRSQLTVLVACRPSCLANKRFWCRGIYTNCNIEGTCH